MKKSRTYHTCESILIRLIQKYGPMARVGWPIVETAIIECAGGDARTVNSYRDNLRRLEFLKANRDATFSLNLKKVDYKQLSLQETLVIAKDDEPP